VLKREYLRSLRALSDAYCNSMFDRMYIFECMHACTVLIKKRNAVARVVLACVCKNMWLCIYVFEPMYACALCSAREGFSHVYCTVMYKYIYVCEFVYECALKRNKLYVGATTYASLCMHFQC